MGTWRWLKLGERMNRRCASEGCPQVPVEHYEHDGVGSDYCMHCADRIKAQIGPECKYPDAPCTCGGAHPA
jgi:hypothetical protein